MIKERRDEMTRKKNNQLLDEIEEKRRYWCLKEDKLDSSLWRTRFGRGYGPL
jgi:hypothetical protein